MSKFKKYYWSKCPDESKFWKKLAGRARTYWRYYNKERWACIQMARHPNKPLLKCADCKKWFHPVNCQVDHIIPLGELPINRIEFFDWLDRLNCSVEELQILAKKCHTKKTNRERNRRKRRKD